MNLFRYACLCLPCLLLLPACNSARKPAPAAVVTADTVSCTQLTGQWNDAHNAKDINRLARLYAGEVMYYGSHHDKKSCLASKQMTFAKYPDYDQQIMCNIIETPQGKDEVRCSFTKRVTFNHQTKNYPSYLVFSRSGSGWAITTEGDAVTDRNLEARKHPKEQTDSVRGDYNGDGVQEYAWLDAPEIDTSGMDCVGDCTSHIRFSDKRIPAIKVEQCIGGVPQNRGDLNEDGSDEIGLLPGWFTSCWVAYKVYTLKPGGWVYAVPPFSTHCNQWEEGAVPIEKDLHHKGHVLIRYTELTDDQFKTRTKSVPIQ